MVTLKKLVKIYNEQIKTYKPKKYEEQLKVYGLADQRPSLRSSPFPDAMSFDEFKLLKSGDKIQIKGPLSGEYTFVSMSLDKCVLAYEGKYNDYYLVDLGVLPYKSLEYILTVPYECDKWNSSNYVCKGK